MRFGKSKPFFHKQLYIDIILSKAERDPNLEVINKQQHFHNAELDTRP